MLGINKVLLGRRRALREGVAQARDHGRATATARPTTGSSATSTRRSTSAGIVHHAARDRRPALRPDRRALIICGIADRCGSRSGPPASSTASATAGATATCATEDASTNIVPWGVVDRRRRAAQQPPRLSDLGQVLDPLVRVRPRLDVHPDPASLGLATVRKTRAEGEARARRSSRSDAATLQAVIAHRFDVMARYAKSMKTRTDEIAQARASSGHFPDKDRPTRLAKWFHRDACEVPAQHRAELRPRLSTPRATCCIRPGRCGDQPRERSSAHQRSARRASSRTGATRRGQRRAAQLARLLAPLLCAATP